MLQPNIGFIGAGNMAGSLIGGLAKNGLSECNIVACDPSEQQLERLRESLGHPDYLSTSVHNQAISDSDVIILAVKPQIIQLVAKDIKSQIKPGALVISIAAGINISSLENWLGNVAVVRCMPNTPALIQQGATGLFANAKVSDDQKSLTETILSAVGIASWVDSEHLIDAVTAVSGSGPAYFFLFTELMAEVGEEMGLERSLAEQLSIQTCLGAGMLAKQSNDNLSTLRNNVTSPGGTTERAIQRFQQDDLKQLIKHAMQDCAIRAEEMAKEFGT